MKKIPNDIEIGWYHDEEHYTNTKLTLRFRSNGEAYLEYDDYCSGISAGNSIGGTYERPLPEGFPKGWTLEKNKELKIFFQQYA